MYPIFYTLLCIFLIVFALVIVWIRLSNKRLSALYAEYRKALENNNLVLASQIEKKYYSTIIFGLGSIDEFAIEKDIMKANLTLTTK